MGALEETLAEGVQGGSAKVNLTPEQKDSLVARLVQGGDVEPSVSERKKSAIQSSLAGGRSKKRDPRAKSRAGLGDGSPLSRRLQAERTAREDTVRESKAAKAKAQAAVDPADLVGDDGQNIEAADETIQRLMDPTKGMEFASTDSGPATRAPSPEELGANIMDASAQIAQEELTQAKARTQASIANVDIHNAKAAEETEKANKIRADGEAEQAKVRGETMEDMREASEAGQDAIKSARVQIDQKMDAYEHAVQAYKTAPVGVTQSRRDKAMSIVAIALGAFGQGQTGGANAASEVLQAAMDQQLKVQQMEINKLGKNIDFSNNALANARRIFDDETQAQRAARTMMLEDMDLALTEVEARSNSKAMIHEAVALRHSTREEYHKFRTDIATQEQSAVRRDATQWQMSALNAKRQARSESARQSAQFREAKRAGDARVAAQQAKLVASIKNPPLNSEKWTGAHSGLKGMGDDLKLIKSKFSTVTGMWDSTLGRLWKGSSQTEIISTWQKMTVGLVRLEQGGRITDTDQEKAEERYGTISFTREETAEGQLRAVENAYHQMMRTATFDNVHEARSVLGPENVRRSLEVITRIEGAEDTSAAF